jgi:hypothetical protein
MKKMKRMSIAGSLVALVFCVNGYALDLMAPFTAEELELYTVKIMPGVWFSDMSGDVMVSDDLASQSGLAATRLDFEDALGMDGSQSDFYGKIYIKPARKHKIRLGYYGLSYNGLQNDVVAVAQGLGINVQSLIDQAGVSDNYIVFSDKAVKGQVAST